MRSKIKRKKNVRRDDLFLDQSAKELNTYLQHYVGQPVIVRKKIEPNYHFYMKFYGILEQVENEKGIQKDQYAIELGNKSIISFDTSVIEFVEEDDKRNENSYFTIWLRSVLNTRTPRVKK